MEKGGIRDQVVIATKFSGNYKRDDDAIPIKINYVDNSHMTLHMTVEAILKNLERLILISSTCIVCN